MAVHSDLVDSFADLVVAGRTPEAAEGQLVKVFGLDPELAREARIAWATRVGRIRELRDPRVIEDSDLTFGDWYAGPKDSDFFWPAVKERLLEELPEDAVPPIDQASSRILGLLRPAGAQDIKSRGLVLGFVQSGKTTNFMSLISKAADRGYKLFIVLSGTTDNLRQQTQSRIEETLVGAEGANWHLLTSLDGDFANPGNAANLLSQDHRLIAVVKKNPYRLRRLRDWLDSASPAILASAPILVIDDEADNASIDVGKDRVSRINSLIRGILKRPKAAYVAYTATPFANVLIDPSDLEDLYPRDFIVDLPRPDDYWGAERIFGRTPIDEDEAQSLDLDLTGLDIVRTVPIDDIELVQPPRGKGAVYGWNPDFAGSLRDAVLWFLLAACARRSRDGFDRHSSMLVHTSMLSEAHNRLAGVIQDGLEEWRRAIRAGNDSVRSEAEKLWAREMSRLPSEVVGQSQVSFDGVWALFGTTLDNVSVVIDNYRSSDRLSYSKDQPTTAIVVGGNTLSRGLTLEGLTSSFFVRAASAYDTLLQMGRWFGYRKGYEDLIRIWMTDELAEWFEDLARVEAEIRSEIQRYADTDLRPEQLPVRIRTHPDMAITAAAKMRGAVKASMSYSGSRPQTILFKSDDRKWLADNWKAADSLISGGLEEGAELVTFGSDVRGLRGVGATRVLRFLREYSFHEAALELRSGAMIKYIERENDSGSLLDWNIAVVEAKDQSNGTVTLSKFGDVGLLERSRLQEVRTDGVSIGALISVVDRVADLPLERNAVKAAVREMTDGELLKLRSDYEPWTGLICLYPISKASKARRAAGRRPRAHLDAVDNMLGVAFFFPESRARGNEVDYVSAPVIEQATEDLESVLEELLAADLADQQSGDAETAATYGSGRRKANQ